MSGLFQGVLLLFSTLLLALAAVFLLLILGAKNSLLLLFFFFFKDVWSSSWKHYLLYLTAESFARSYEGKGDKWKKTKLQAEKIVVKLFELSQRAHRERSFMHVLRQVFGCGMGKIHRCWQEKFQAKLGVKCLSVFV